MKILIAGAGIAGLSAAYWLTHYGFEVDIIDKTDNVQSRQGYMIDFWGPGYDVAEKMQMLDQLREKDYLIDALKFVDETGKTDATLNVTAMRKLLGDRVFTFMRGDLESALLEEINPGITVQTATTIKALNETENKITVTFQDDTEKTYDFVIGADGIHSNVRQLVFGNENQFTKYLGYRLGTFIQPNNVDIHNNFYAYSVPEKQVSIYPTKDGRLATFFIYKSDKQLAGDSKERLHKHFDNVGWVVARILSNLDQADEVFLDTLTQIKMPKWYQGRVALIGDACQCLTLMAGQGASMAMAGAYTLANRLYRHKNNHEAAFNSYQSIIKPDIVRKQTEARKFIRSFVPNTKFGIRCRNFFTPLMTNQLIAKLFFKGFLKETLKLPG